CTLRAIGTRASTQCLLGITRWTAGFEFSAADLALAMREQRRHIARVQAEEVAVQRHLERAHRQPALEAQIQRAVEQTTDAPCYQSIPPPDAFYRFNDRPTASHRPAAAGGDGAGAT